jgi:hypothetical protein
VGCWFLCPKEAEGGHSARVQAARAQFKRHLLPKPQELHTPTHIVLAANAINNALPCVYQSGEDFIVVAGTLFYKGKVGLPALAQMLEDVTLPFEDWDSVMGHFAVLIYKKGQLFTFSDYFGAFQIFMAQAGQLLSTSFLTLIECVEKLTPHTQAIYEYAFNSVSLGNETIFREITLLDPQLQLLISPELRSIQMDKTLSTQEDTHPIEQLVEQHSARLTAMARLIASHYGDKVQCPLSGGFDSRLVLAMLRRAGIKPHVYVYGNPTGQDVTLAREIGAAEGFSVEYFDKTGFSAITPHDFPAQVERDFHAVDGLPQDGSVLDNGGNAQARWNRQCNGDITASGGSGEVFRNFFYLARSRYALKDIVDAFYSQYDPATTTRMFDAFVHKQAIEAKLSEGLGRATGVLERRQVDALYPKVRSRSFFGREISLVGRYGAYFMPFLEMPVVRDALRLPLDEKEHGRFEARLIAAIDPKLAAYRSSYGHNFLEEPNLKTRFINGMTLVRPPKVRRFSYRIRHRIGNPSDGHGGITAPEYISKIIDLDYPAMQRYFNIAAIRDFSLLRRVIILEYFISRLGRKVDLTL